MDERKAGSVEAGRFHLYIPLGGRVSLSVVLGRPIGGLDDEEMAMLEQANHIFMESVRIDHKRCRAHQAGVRLREEK